MSKNAIIMTNFWAEPQLAFFKFWLSAGSVRSQTMGTAGSTGVTDARFTES